MILDKISVLSAYEGVHPLINRAVEFIKNNDLTAIPLGKYQLEDGCFVSILEYETAQKDDPELESHKKYVDIQCIISGKEKITWQNICAGQVSKEYNADKDMTMYKTAEPVDFILPAGYMCVFFPSDLHAPNQTVCCAERVRKALFKLPVL